MSAPVDVIVAETSAATAEGQRVPVLVVKSPNNRSKWAVLHVNHASEKVQLNGQRIQILHVFASMAFVRLGEDWSLARSVTEYELVAPDVHTTVVASLTNGAPVTLKAPLEGEFSCEAEAAGHIVAVLGLVLADGKAYGVNVSPNVASSFDVVSMVDVARVIHELDELSITRGLARLNYLPQAFLPLALNPRQRHFVQPYAAIVFPIVATTASLFLLFLGAGYWIAGEAVPNPLVHASMILLTCVVGVVAMDSWKAALRLLAYAALVLLFFASGPRVDPEWMQWTIGGSQLGVMLALSRLDRSRIRSSLRVIGPGLAAVCVLLVSQLSTIAPGLELEPDVRGLLKDVTSFDGSGAAKLAVFGVAALVFLLVRRTYRDITGSKLPKFWTPVVTLAMGYAAAAAVVGGFRGPLPKGTGDALLVGAFLVIVWLVGRGDWRLPQQTGVLHAICVLASGLFTWGALYLALAFLVGAKDADRKFSEWMTLIHFGGIGMVFTMAIELRLRALRSRRTRS